MAGDKRLPGLDNTIPFGQCDGVGNEEKGLREPIAGGEFARLVYVDDKQGCTNVSGNSTNRNEWFMSEVSWKELARVTSRFSIWRVRRYSFEASPASRENVALHLRLARELAAKALAEIFPRRLIFFSSNERERKIEILRWEEKSKTRSAH